MDLATEEFVWRLIAGAIVFLFIFVPLLKRGHFCPHCRSWINKKARVCRYCGRDV
jgi:predicted amidophosphoribosyltransferase